MDKMFKTLKVTNTNLQYNTVSNQLYKSSNTTRSSMYKNGLFQLVLKVYDTFTRSFMYKVSYYS